jgi:hypothetical protein
VSGSSSSSLGLARGGWPECLFLGMLPRAKAVVSESKGPKTGVTPLGAMGREQGRGGGRQLKKQKLAAEVSKVGPKLSPERMLIVLDSLREYPVLWHAAGEAGIHRKTLAYWLKRSAAGDVGYDIEWQGLMWRFREHCQSAIEEAYERLREVLVAKAMGVVYKTDPCLVDSGYRGPDAYLRDENGNPVVETGKQNPRMLRLFLESERPEIWGKRRKMDLPRTGGLLVVGVGTKKPVNNSASIKARQWKSWSRKIREEKP